MHVFLHIKIKMTSSIFCGIFTDRDSFITEDWTGEMTQINGLVSI